ADHAPPDVTVRAPKDGGTYSPGRVVTASYRCTDPAGVAECRGTVPNDAAIDVSAGPHAFVIKARDRAGNGTSKVVHYTGAATKPADVTPPTVTIDAPKPGRYAVSDGGLSTSFSCSDDLDGTSVASCTGAVVEVES